MTDEELVRRLLRAINGPDGCVCRDGCVCGACAVLRCALADVRREERERCARVAESVSMDAPETPCSCGKSHGRWRTPEQMREAIAAAIRKEQERCASESARFVNSADEVIALRKRVVKLENAVRAYFRARDVEGGKKDESGVAWYAETVAALAEIERLVPREDKT